LNPATAATILRGIKCLQMLGLANLNRDNTSRKITKQLLNVDCLEIYPKASKSGFCF